MNATAGHFVNYMLNDAPLHNKTLVLNSAVSRFSLIKDGAMYRNEFFAVRFCYSSRSSATFSNTVLALSKLEKIDRIPFFVVLVRKSASNLILLANSTFLSKISHSSMMLTKENIRGSFNGSDIMRTFNGIANCPENFDTLFAFHQGLDWTDNLERLVVATSKIEPDSSRFNLDGEKRKNVLDSVGRAELFVNSPEYKILLDDLNSRCQACRNEIIVASHIENTNVRGRLIEAMVTADGPERVRLFEQLAAVESQLPVYDVQNGLGDYVVRFRSRDVYTDIKTKIVYLNSNPKAYNVDKFLERMSDSRSVFMFFFIGIDKQGAIRTILCSVYHSKLVENTVVQFHWAGRSSRGVTQFRGVAIEEMLSDDQFANSIDRTASREFLERLMDL